MKFNITALIDEATRKELKEVLLGTVKSLTREIMTETILGEIRRKLDNAQTTDRYYWQNQIERALMEAMKRLLEPRWGEIGRQIVASAQAAVEKAVADKLANKVIWEAQQQRDFMREIAKEEVREYLKGMFGSIK